MRFEEYSRCSGQRKYRQLVRCEVRSDCHLTALLTAHIQHGCSVRFQEVLILIQCVWEKGGRKKKKKKKKRERKLICFQFHVRKKNVEVI